MSRFVDARDNGALFEELLGSRKHRRPSEKLRGKKGFVFSWCRRIQGCIKQLINI
jgi:hypothetical protein